MKNLFINKISAFCLLITVALLSSTTTGKAQTLYQSHDLDIRLNGTSNLHDWEMKAVQGTSEAAFLIDAQGKLSSLSKLSFTLPATNLKSGHKGMDKNTYKALDTDKNPNITFVLTSATVTTKAGNNYQFDCIGKMTIAGTTLETTLVAIGNYDPATKSFTVTGVKKMKMTDYHVKPPTAVLGTIKTGDDISISYNLKFTK